MDSYPLEAYLEIEATSDQKFEYHDGMLVAMAGGTPEHGLVALNFGTELNNLFKAHGKPCRSYSSDVKVHIWTANRMFYPDVSVICGPKETSIKDPQAITNPVLVLEVLSESTRDLDYGSKFLTYRQLPSLQEYVLAHQDAARVDVYSRSEQGWELRTFEGWEETIALPHLGGSIAMADIYRMVEGVDPNTPTSTSN